MAVFTWQLLRLLPVQGSALAFGCCYIPPAFLSSLRGCLQPLCLSTLTQCQTPCSSWLSDAALSNRGLVLKKTDPSHGAFVLSAETSSFLFLFFAQFASQSSLLELSHPSGSFQCSGTSLSHQQLTTRGVLAQTQRVHCSLMGTVTACHSPGGFCSSLRHRGYSAHTAGYAHE